MFDCLNGKVPLFSPTLGRHSLFNTVNDTGEITPRLVGADTDRYTDRPVLNTFEIIIAHHCRDYLKLQHITLIAALFSVSGEYDDFYLLLGASP